MNPFDIVIIIVLGVCLIRGVFRGFIKELSSIIGVLGGFYAAYTYYVYVAEHLSGWISNISYLNILSFLIVFCGVFFIISVLGVIIKYILNIAFLGWIDRIFGGGFGIFKGILIISVLLIALTAFLPKEAPVIKNSHLARHVTQIAEIMSKVISPQMKQEFSEKMEGLKKSWENND
ncbi:MAG: CvpA family protein [Deltaproteobacteria bacterium]|nr:CvpA family protein [Deltaproteobacteria bacterium]